MRWTPARKANVVREVRTNVMSLAQACERYQLTIPEYEAWERGVDAHGLPALRITYTQQYRGAP
jgi:hypothetical protein